MCGSRAPRGAIVPLRPVGFQRESRDPGTELDWKVGPTQFNPQGNHHRSPRCAEGKQ